MRTEKFFRGREFHELKNIIYEKTGFYIRSNCLLMQIFTRSSFSAEQGGENNEILEFLKILSNYRSAFFKIRIFSINSSRPSKFLT